MAKTIVCDICGRTQEDMRIYAGPGMYSFRQTKHLFSGRHEVDDVDICCVCLGKIREASLKEKEKTDE